MKNNRVPITAFSLSDITRTGLKPLSHSNPDHWLSKEDKLQMLDQAIYDKRQQLYQCADAYGLSDPRCLHYSMELDELINAFNKIKMQKKDS